MAKRSMMGVALTGFTLLLAGCAPLGSLMSPYSEKFSCKNDDHGQCIHPERAYEDAVAGITSGSTPAVTNSGGPARPNGSTPRNDRSSYDAYRGSVYRELKGLIDAPETPMLKPARTIRTLILPYADRQRPDRLYMPRYIYSILDRPEWVVGSPLVRPPLTKLPGPLLGQIQEGGAAQPTTPVRTPAAEATP